MKGKSLLDRIQDYKRITAALTKQDSVYHLWNKEKERLLKYKAEKTLDKIKDKRLKVCAGEIWDHYEDSLTKCNEFITKDLYSDPFSLKIRPKIEDFKDVSLDQSGELSSFIKLKDNEELKVIVNLAEEVGEEALAQDPGFTKMAEKLKEGLDRVSYYDVEHKLQNIEEKLEASKSKFYFLSLLTEIFVKLDHKNSRTGIKYPYDLNECLSKIQTNEFDILRQELEDSREREAEVTKKYRKVQKDFMDLTEKFSKFRSKIFTQIQLIDGISERLKGKGEIIDVEGLKKITKIVNSDKLATVVKDGFNDGSEIKRATAFMKILNEKLNSVEKISDLDLINQKELEHRRRTLFEYYSAEVKFFEKRLLEKNEPAKSCLRALIKSPMILKESVGKFKDQNVQADEIRDYFGKKYSKYRNAFKEDLKYYNEIRFDDSPLEIDFQDCLASPGDLGKESRVFLIENSMAIISNPPTINRFVSFSDDHGITKNDLAGDMRIVDTGFIWPFVYLVDAKASRIMRENIFDKKVEVFHKLKNPLKEDKFQRDFLEILNNNILVFREGSKKLVVQAQDGTVLETIEVDSEIIDFKCSGSKLVTLTQNVFIYVTEYTLSPQRTEDSRSKFLKNEVELERFKGPLHKAIYLRLSSNSKNGLIQIMDGKKETIDSLVQVNFFNRRQNVVDISSRYLTPTHRFQFLDSFNKGKSHICLVGDKKVSESDLRDPEFTQKNELLMLCYDDFMMDELKEMHQELDFRVKSNLYIDDDSVFLVSGNGVLYQMTFVWIKIAKRKRIQADEGSKSSEAHYDNASETVYSDEDEF